MIPVALTRQAITIHLCIFIIAVTSLGCSPQVDPSFEPGKKIYENYCAACHGVNGAGLLYRKSALNNSALVLGEPDKVIAVILFGREGAGAMPGWRETLNDQEVAAVATYTRQAWSNRADAITPAMVTAIRSQGEKRFSTNPLPLR
jgi:mono/diheme cytochrome c family protein